MPSPSRLVPLLLTIAKIVLVLWIGHNVAYETTLFVLVSFALSLPWCCPGSIQSCNPSILPLGVKHGRRGNESKAERRTLQRGAAVVAGVCSGAGRTRVADWNGQRSIRRGGAWRDRDRTKHVDRCAGVDHQRHAGHLRDRRIDSR